jgi:hypothetical protein
MIPPEIDAWAQRRASALKGGETNMTADAKPFAVLGNPSVRLENSIPTPEEQEMRFRCLQLAHGHEWAPMDVVSRAKDYYAFVTGQPAQTPRQMINAALDKANVS